MNATKIEMDGSFGQSAEEMTKLREHARELHAADIGRLACELDRVASLLENAYYSVRDGCDPTSRIVESMRSADILADVLRERFSSLSALVERGSSLAERVAEAEAALVELRALARETVKMQAGVAEEAKATGAQLRKECSRLAMFVGVTVGSFSEVSTELISEIQRARLDPDVDVDTLADLVESVASRLGTEAQRLAGKLVSASIATAAGMEVAPTGEAGA